MFLHFLWFKRLKCIFSLALVCLDFLFLAFQNFSLLFQNLIRSVCALNRFLTFTFLVGFFFFFFLRKTQREAGRTSVQHKPFLHKILQSELITVTSCIVSDSYKDTTRPIMNESLELVHHKLNSNPDA